MTLDEEKAEIAAKLNAIFERRRKPPKPKAVTENGEVIRDAKVRVSVDDPNARRRGSEEVIVTRPDPEWLLGSHLRPGTVRINMAEYERQWHERDAANAMDRHQRQSLNDADPMGVWHNPNGEDR